MMCSVAGCDVMSGVAGYGVWCDVAVCGVVWCGWVSCVMWCYWVWYGVAGFNLPTTVRQKRGRGWSRSHNLN